MSSNKVLVTGATGLLGREVVLAFKYAGWDVVGTGFSRAQPPLRRIELTDSSAVSSLLDEEKYGFFGGGPSQHGNSTPRVIVHCAANRFPDKCDADPQGARAINVAATSHLARAAASRSVLLIYISTDYVFPGRPGEAPYEADAPTAPPNLYGQTKLDGEKVVLQAIEGTSLGVVLRVPVLYGKGEDEESAINVLTKSVWMAAKNSDASIAMDDWARRYPTNTEDVGRVCKDVAERYLSFSTGDSSARPPKILQFTAEECFTKYEVCQLMAEVYGVMMPGMVPNKEGNDLKSAVQRPYDTHLSTRLLKELGIDMSAMSLKAWL